MKKILLLGATGTAGSAISKKLLSDTAYHITLFARHAGEHYSEDSVPLLSMVTRKTWRT